MPFSETAVHPLDANPVTNEHTAKMTLARNSAMEHYTKGRYAQAEAKFQESLQEAVLGFGPGDPHVPCARNMLAEFYRNTQQFSKAEPLYQQALSELEALYGERHWLYASALHNLALGYEAVGRLDDAQAAMERVMALRRAMFGPRHFLYADTLFALGSIMLKQAVMLRAAGAPPQQADAQGPGPGSSRGWWGRLRGKAGDASAAAGQGLERQGLGLMADAVQILEEAENVQVNQVVGWLGQLGEAYSERGRAQEAAQCAAKAMHYFALDKGEQHARASQLSDSLIEALLTAGDVAGARDAAAACAAARQQVFGKELAVAHAWLRLARLELQLPQANTGAALQHARNAAQLAGELLADYSRASASNWMGKAGQGKHVKRARAAHLHASALKFTAEHAPPGASSVPDLERAVGALESGVAAASQVLQRALAGAGQPLPAEELDELAGLLVEQQLLLFECLDALAQHLAVEAQTANGQWGAAAKVRHAEVAARLDRLSRELMAAGAGA